MAWPDGVEELERCLCFPIRSGFLGERDVEWGDIMATATVAVLPPTLLVMLVQQNLIKGLTLGAVKG